MIYSGLTSLLGVYICNRIGIIVHLLPNAQMILSYMMLISLF